MLRPGLYGRPVEVPDPTTLGTLTARSAGGAYLSAPQSVHTQNPKAVNPILEQPRLIWNSAAQPITIEGWRRWVRTYMHASGPLGGYVFQAPRLVQPFDRGHMAGVQSRGTTYQWAPANTGPAPERTVVLNQSWTSRVRGGGRPTGRGGPPAVGR